jgi:hypothetical protein
MKLITEEIENVEIIVESINGKKNLFIEGVFLQGDICNRNKRIYPMETLRMGVKTYVENYLDKGRAVGELGHPSGPTINLDRVSHKIISLKESGNNYIGKAKILTTQPMGKIAAGLYEEGVKLGVSSRGVGSLVPTNEGYSRVSEDFMLSTAADIVHDPSAPSAFVEGIYEGVDWLYDSKKQEWIAKSIKEQIENDVISRRLSEERMLQHFENYLNMI